MYGHCATSLTVEPVAFEIEDSIVVGWGCSVHNVILSTTRKHSLLLPPFTGNLFAFESALTLPFSLTQPGEGYMKQEELNDKDECQTPK
jgi:hypothetical protein